MRSMKRERQEIWFCEVDEIKDGIDTVYSYKKPIKKKMTVSSTSGTPEEISAGIVPNYDRYITSYDRKFKPKEGFVLWVDVKPKIDEEGNLIINEETELPEVQPDYRLSRIIDTEKGNIARYGIVKIGGNQ